MASRKADVGRLLDLLVTDYGCDVRITKDGHWRVTRPGYRAITVSATPSDKRAMHNVLSEVRRHLGVDLKA